MLLTLAVELLGHAGDAIFADVSSISVRLRQAAAVE